MHPANSEREITIRDLYPHLTEEQLKEAEENFERYIELELRVYERILNGPEAYARFKALTASRRDSKMNGEKVDCVISKDLILHEEI